MCLFFSTVLCTWCIVGLHVLWYRVRWWMMERGNLTYIKNSYTWRVVKHINYVIQELSVCICLFSWTFTNVGRKKNNKPVSRYLFHNKIVAYLYLHNKCKIIQHIIITNYDKNFNYECNLKEKVHAHTHTHTSHIIEITILAFNQLFGNMISHVCYSDSIFHQNDHSVTIYTEV